MGTLVLGYQFSRPVGDRGSSSIELELGFSGSEDLGIDSEIGNGEYDVQAAGIYFNYRSPGTVYFKGKIGLLDTNIDTKLASGAEFKSNDAALAFGLGAGVRLGGDDGRATPGSGMGFLIRGYRRQHVQPGCQYRILIRSFS